jgi:hypothetical protein
MDSNNSPTDRSLPDCEGACLGAIRFWDEDPGDRATPQRSAGLRFTAAVQRSWFARRTVNPGLLALSTLRDDERCSLLDAWVECGGGTPSFFPAETDALLDVIAAQLPDPSPELSLCRLEQLTLRANNQASSFRARNPAFLERQRTVRRAHHAGIVHFDRDPEAILSTLLQRRSLPRHLEATALLVAPGLHRLWRIASPGEVQLWNRLSTPAAAMALLEEGYPPAAIESMLHVGALEYT